MSQSQVHLARGTLMTCILYGDTAEKPQMLNRDGKCPGLFRDINAESG